MIEAYAIGVNLTLSGGIGSQIAAVASQFENLNRIIASSQTAVNELAAGMRGLTRLGRGAADAWKDAAAAMERAARATRQAQSGGGPRAPGIPPGPAVSETPAGATGARPGTALVPYAGGFATLPGATGGGSFPRGPAGGALVPTGPSGPFAGGAGTGGPLVPSDAPFDGRGPIPLNYTAPRVRPERPGTHDMTVAATTFGAAGAALAEFVAGSMKARAEVEHMQSVLGRMGFTAEQTKEALKRATDLQQTVPGMTVGGGLEIIKDMMAVTQNREEALNPELLRSLSQTAVVLKAQGKSDAVAELFKAMQGAELRGALSGADGHPDIKKAQGFLENVLATTIQTGGRVGPSEILQFIKSGGMGAAMLSDRSLFAEAVVPIISMGAARAGTGIQAFAQQFAAGKMSDAGANMLREMDLLDMSKVPLATHMVGRGKNRHEEPLDDQLKQYKVGIGQYRIPPDILRGMSDPETNPREHPIQFMEKVLLPKIDAYNQSHYGAPRDDKDRDAQRMATGAALASRIPGGNILGDVLRNWSLVMREITANAEALKRGDNNGNFNQLQATDPKVKMEAFSAALNGLMVALGGPIMDSAIGAIQSITSALNTLSNFAAAHPDLTKNIMLATASVAGFSLAMAALSGVFLVAGPMFRVATWAAMALGMGTLNVAMRGLAGAIALFEGATLATLGGLATGFRAVAAGLAAIGSAGTTLAGVGAGLAALGAALGAFAFWKGGTKDPIEAQKHLEQQRREDRRDPMQGAPMDGFGVDGRPVARPQSYQSAPPRDATPQKVEIHVEGKVDGRTLLAFVAQGMTKSGSGPSGGTTGFDQRTLFSGSMAAA